MISFVGGFRVLLINSLRTTLMNLLVSEVLSKNRLSEIDGFKKSL